MALYAMGDIHGCYREFKKLLEKMEFNHAEDKLYLVGDMINRGPKSEKVLDYLLEHQTSILPVLGNHDLAFLVFQADLIRLKRHDTYGELKESEQIQKYVQYLRSQPLMRYIPEVDIAICHAGIYPEWTIEEALALSKEVEAIFQNDETYAEFLPIMFGNEPNAWKNDLVGVERIRFIINAMTRMRYLYQDGRLDFNTKQPIDEVMEDLIPWFRFPNQFGKTCVIFGHWASLGLHDENNIICIDTGCAWGEKLTAIRLDAKPMAIFHKKNKNH